MTAVGKALRTVSALLLVSGAAGIVYAAQELVPPLEAPGAEVVRPVRVPAGATTAVCHGAPELPEDSVAYDEDFNPVPVEPRGSLAVGSFPREGTAGEGTWWTESDAGEAGSGEAGSGGTGLDGSPVRWFRTDAVGALEAPGWALVDPVGEDAALVAGTGAWLVDAGDLRSLVAGPCLTPANELWLVGGATTLGRSALLELVNPGETTVTVGVEGWGPTGPVDLPLLESVSLAPRTSTRVLVEASAADVERLALHVRASGGRVSAALVDAALTGVTPQGVELVVPTAAPATELLFPGVSLAEPDPEAGDHASSANVLRLLNPGTEPAEAAVEILSADGATPVPGATALTVDAGAVFEITLAGLPAGDHAVRVTSDQPITGAVQTGRAATLQGDDAVTLDRAWTVAVPATTRAAVVLPEIASARLVLANPGTGDAVVRLVRYGGAAPLEIRIPAGSSETVETVEADGLAVMLESDLPVVAAAVLEAEAPDGTLISVVPFTVDANERQTVDVLVAGN